MIVAIKGIKLLEEHRFFVRSFSAVVRELFGVVYHKKKYCFIERSFELFFSRKLCRILPKTDFFLLFLSGFFARQGLAMLRLPHFLTKRSPLHDIRENFNRRRFEIYFFSVVLLDFPNAFDCLLIDTSEGRP